MALADTQREPGSSDYWPGDGFAAASPRVPGEIDVDGLLLLGISIAARGQTARAAAILDRVARERPDAAHPCGDLAGLLPRLTRAQVDSQYRACLRIAPEDTRLTRAFADFLWAAGDSDGAIAALREVLRQGPSAAATHRAMGLALAEHGHIADAIWHLEQAVGSDAGSTEGWASLGRLLRTARRFRSALAAYDQALIRAPDDALIRLGRAEVLLQAGRWTEAWPDYEWRLRVAGNPPRPRSRQHPPLSSAEDLAGSTVLLTHETGAGDTVQCLRYLRLLAERGMRVLAQVPAPLMRLVRAMPGVAGVAVAGQEPPPHDLHCPFLSLPGVFATTQATIPRPPYLTAEPALAAAWRQRLPVGDLRIGLVWAARAHPGSAEPPREPGVADRRRSVALAALAPLSATPGRCFISLQAGAAADQARSPPAGMAVFDPMPDVADFADTAAIIANLDLVVSVDTAVAHLAGAMGRPVFLLDRYDNCWRWLSGRADSPWYPSMTIFRQERMGDWTAPIARAAAALDSLAAFHGLPHQNVSWMEA